MKKFFRNILLYLLALAGIAFLYILMLYLRPDFVDDFYYRFTTPKAPSLILGTSRPAQGIKPSVINDLVCNENNQIINHSFALGPSSFGPNYFREIKQKLLQDSKSGLFIIAVDPWSLATGIDNIQDDSLLFFENQQNLFVGNLRSSSANPNFDYLINHWSNKFVGFLNAFKHLIKYKGILQLHADGWLEVNIAMDPESIKNRILSSTKGYEEKKVMLSNTRFDYLEKIIRYLDKRGNVFLVRMPVSLEMKSLENDRFPDFDKYIETIAAHTDVPYFNFIDESGDFQTIDTHHLYKKESERFTRILCEIILDHTAK
jgi:hypothetical protein